MLRAGLLAAALALSPLTAQSANPDGPLARDAPAESQGLVQAQGPADAEQPSESPRSVVPEGLTYQEARWHPLHFKPAILTATDEQCLVCHAEILAHRVRRASPAGVESADALAWYQTLDTYEGYQTTLHRRHLETDYARQVMDLKCNSCHVGNDPREETGMSHAGGDPTLTQRKQVDPEICLLCHGRFPYELMGVPGPWLEYAHVFQDDCLLCHELLRTTRHQVNYLKPAAIEAAAKEQRDVCFGCHGGRAWYRISYPYPRHAWPGMPEVVPEWAEGRPTESQPRFLLGLDDSPAPAGGPTTAPSNEGAADRRGESKPLQAEPQ